MYDSEGKLSRFDADVFDEHNAFSFMVISYKFVALNDFAHAHEHNVWQSRLYQQG